MRIRRIAATCLLALTVTGAGGADLKSVSVKLEDDRYHLVSRAWFDASVDELYATLTDYDKFMKFTSAIVESRNVEADAEGRPRYYTRMEGCVLLFCKSMRRAGYLILNPPDEIIAIGDPEESDFRFSRESWKLEPDGDGTLMTYNFEMEPAFWVPPVVGPFMIKRTLREGGIDAIDRIEAVAQGREPEE